MTTDVCLIVNIYLVKENDLYDVIVTYMWFEYILWHIFDLSNMLFEVF